MSIRNFYFEGHIDGRQTDLMGGPSNKEGGMRLYVTQRNNGAIETAFNIRSWVQSDGKLITVVTDHEGNVVGQRITDR